MQVWQLMKNVQRTFSQLTLNGPSEKRILEITSSGTPSLSSMDLTREVFFALSKINAAFT